MIKSRCMTAVVFIIFLVAAYAVMGYARHSSYDKVIEEHVVKFAAVKEEDLEKPLALEGLPYLGTPEGAAIIEDPVFKEVVYSMHRTYVGYHAEYHADLLPTLLEEVDDQKWSLWDAYKRQAIFEALWLDIYIGGNTAISLGPTFPTDMYGSLAESIALWESAGGEREDDWFESYEASPHYKAWLNQYFADISGPKELDPPPKVNDYLDEEYTGFFQEMYELHTPMSVEERYITSTEELELPFWVNLFCRDILEAEQHLIEVTYSRYMAHLSERDIVRTAIDAGIVEYTGDYLDRTAKKGYDLSRILNESRFPLTDLIVDALIIFGFSLAATVLVVKKVLPRFKL